MNKVWLPRPVYEAKPWGALLAGAAVGLGSFLRTLSAGAWEWLFAVAFVVGCCVVVYGGAVLQMRQEYRRSAVRRRGPGR